MSPYPKDDVRYTPTPDEEIAEVKAVKLSDLPAFHHQFYGASVGEAAVVGDFDAKGFPALVGDLLAGWKSPSGYTRVPNLYHEVPSLDKAFETPDKENAYYVSGVELPMTSDDPDYPALSLANYIIGGGFLNSRLATRVRQKEGLSYGVGSYFSANTLDKLGDFGVYAIYAPQNAEKVKTAIREVLETAVKGGFTDKEVEAARAGMLQGRQVDRAKDTSLVGRLEYYLFVGRTMKWDEDFEAKLKGLTAKEVSDALRRHLDLARINVIMAGDFNKTAARPSSGPKAP
jgi:zinc protease